MKGDFTRRTFKSQKHYSSVQMQQGRVQLDSDWNEEVAIIDHRWRATLEDTVGPNGSPKVGGGFGITAITGTKGEDLLLSPGRLYVDGILCEVDSPYLYGSVVDPAAGTLLVTGVLAGVTRLAVDEWVRISAKAGVLVAQITGLNPPATNSADSTLTVTPLAGSTLPVAGTSISITPVVTYLTQPDLQSPPAIDMFTTQNQYFGKTYIAYLDVFQRHIIAIDDPAIREVALNGPDTGTRTRTTWQVRLVEVDSMTTCADLILPAAPPPASGTFAPPVASTGRMRARAIPTSDPVQDCLLPAEAGFRRLENQLYRVEIHQPGDLATATFKWSRDNGSVAVDWKGCPKPGELTIAGTPQDAAQGFESGQWVELTDDVRELSPDGSVLGIFVQLGVPDGDTLKYAGPPALTPSDYDVTFKDHHPKVRRWESDAKKLNVVGGGWITLEDGVEVQFASGEPDPQVWFNKGDYWLIPARTATTDVEWPNDPPGMPVALRPHGIEHRYCALALLQVHSGGQITTLDCRPQFPALTAIAATDVSYDNSNCQLINATNVQQALDALCKVRVDLSHHNKLIHGYGIVCGLQVVCNSATGEWVTVKSGYAVDCNGNDVETTMDTPVDVGLLISQMSSSPLDSSQNGEVSLIIGVDKHAQVQITAEKYKPPTSEVDELFDGTLLLDYYDDCIKPFQDFMKKELDQLPGDPPITSRQELASAFINLLAQGPNPQAGQNVYISAKEHYLLSRLYADLKPKITSDTFCALFDNARPYPQDNADGVMPHVFGAGQQTRIKWRTNANEFYTLSNGNDPTKLEPRINRYDGASGKLMVQMDPTGGATTGPIIDFTFSAKGNTIYVILASAANSTDTLYVTGAISPAGVTWDKQVITLAGVRFATIEGVIINNRQYVAAIAIGKGLYHIDPTKPATLQPVSGAFAFNASGHMAVAHPNGELQSNVLLIAATYNVGQNTPPSYDSVRIIEFLGLGNPAQFDIHLPSGGGSDGLVWGGGAGSEIGVYVVIGSTSKAIAGYPRRAQGWGPQPGVDPVIAVVDSCAIHMAADRRFLWWASQDFYTLNLIDLAKSARVTGWQLPTQVGPVDIALSPLSGQFGQSEGPLAVLNRPADSILLVPHNLLYAQAADTSKILVRSVAYHKAAVEAYVDLLAGFVQYLKDCFCDHLLVKCAECNSRNEKLYLGVVSIRNNKVHNVCNFSGRHYLKTFPTIGYWMSLFPIVPIIGELIELICCYVIPDAAAKYGVPQYNPQSSGATPVWSLDSLFNTMQEIQNLDLRSQLATWLQKFGLAKHMVGVGAGFRQLSAPPAPGPAGFVAGTSTTSAAGALAQLGMTVQTKPFIPSLGPPVMSNLIDIFRQPAGPTGPVALHQTAGQVVFTSNPAAQPSVTSLQQQLLAKDAQLQQVQTQLQAVNAQLADLHAFRQQVTQQLARMGGGAAPSV